MIAWLAIFVFVLVVLIWYYYHSKKVVAIEFFYLPGCPACQNSRPYWEHIKNAIKKSPDSKINSLNVVEYNVLLDGRKIAEKEGIVYVPAITKKYGDGQRVQYPSYGFTKDKTPNNWEPETVIKWLL